MVDQDPESDIPELTAAWLTFFEAHHLRHRGQLEESSKQLIDLVRGLSGEDDAGVVVYLLALEDLVVNLALERRGGEARQWLSVLEERLDELARQSGEPLSDRCQADRSWTRGLVFDALGEWASAAECYRRARKVRWNDPNDLTLLSLDLAAVELEQGNTEEAAELANDMDVRLTLITGLDIEKEIELLGRALRYGRATVAEVRQAAWRMRVPFGEPPTTAMNPGASVGPP